MSAPAHWYALPDRTGLRELKRPWKLLTFATAMALLLYGALNFGIGDWDVGVTLLMGGLTYVFAPLGIRAGLHGVRHPGVRSAIDVLIALALAWWTIDGVYLVYHRLVGNPIYRADNFNASTPIYLMAGMFWLYRGSLSELFANLRQLSRRPHPRD